MPPTLAFGASGIYKCVQGDWGSGLSLVFAGLTDSAGYAALIRYGDPEIKAHQASSHKEIQDTSLWQRLTSPRQAPHEFSATMASFSTAGIISSAIAQPNTVNAVMAASCVFAALAMMTAEKDAAALGPAEQATSRFNRLAQRSKNWIQEKPLRAAFYFYAPCNVAQMVDGYQRKDWWMAGSGALFLAVNALRSFSSKRTRIIPETPTAG